MITKELLSEVLGEEVTNCGIEDNIVWWTIPKVFGHKTINVHELAHKCKEWAMEKYAMVVNSEIHASGKAVASVYKDENIHIAWTDSYKNDEPEAIFKACEWVRENR